MYKRLLLFPARVIPDLSDLSDARKKSDMLPRVEGDAELARTLCPADCEDFDPPIPSQPDRAKIRPKTD